MPLRKSHARFAGGGPRQRSELHGPRTPDGRNRVTLGRPPPRGKLKPECSRKQERYENVIGLSRFHERGVPVASIPHGVGSAGAGLKVSATTFAQPPAHAIRMTHLPSHHRMRHAGGKVASNESWNVSENERVRKICPNSFWYNLGSCARTLLPRPGLKSHLIRGSW
jgi:hypothetical protein